MHRQFHPDVAFGVHPDLGIAAAVADDRPFLDEVLRNHHFLYSQDLGIYLLPGDTPYNTAVRTVTSATREFQDSGLSVAADPRIMLPPPVPTPDGVPVRETVPGQSLTALTSELHELRRSADVADLLDQILDEHHGTVSDLEEFIDTAAAWCDRLESPNGHELGQRLRTIAHHVAFLGDQLADAQLDLSVMADLTPDGASLLAEVPLPARYDVLPVTRAARARAAVASSPHRQADAVPSPKAPRAPQMTPPGTSHAR
ncbi:hypothetical protein [Streptomyces sp. H27-D2]|uniref:hypothetical protein n=1 Tax=Streptomyces sp. H27-D2 TaxID=3046304 RepID=UPI002DBEE4E6|nr:hypothetical protein [Streptomyces sp. H27-D2]MEC4018274.1 hypothetical protein [Streptomyces sp. H27-D2]